MTAYEIPRERLLNNQRNRFPKKHKSTWRKEREGMASAHLELIRKMPCCSCLKMRPAVIIDPHHLKGGEAAKERSIGVKATDRWAVPLCRLEHDELERIASRREPEFFYDRGINPYELALALFAVTGDLEKMILVLRTQRELFAKVD